MADLIIDFFGSQFVRVTVPGYTSDLPPEPVVDSTRLPGTCKQLLRRAGALLGLTTAGPY